MGSTTFLLDANVFIEAARRYYAFDIAPPFWEILEVYGRSRTTLSIDRVKEEVRRGSDELASWVDGSGSDLFLATGSPDVVEAYRDVMAWVQQQPHFFDSAKYDFARKADGWLAAYAVVSRQTIVTHEVFKPEIRRDVPLPNVCVAFGIPFINTFDMLRTLGVRFAGTVSAVRRAAPPETA